MTFSCCAPCAAGSCGGLIHTHYTQQLYDGFAIPARNSKNLSPPINRTQLLTFWCAEHIIITVTTHFRDIDERIYEWTFSHSLSLLHPCPYNPAHIEWQIHTSPHMYIVPYNNKCPITIYSCAHSIGPDPLAPKLFDDGYAFKDTAIFLLKIISPNRTNTERKNPIQPAHTLALPFSVSSTAVTHLGQRIRFLFLNYIYTMNNICKFQSGSYSIWLILPLPSWMDGRSRGAKLQYRAVWPEPLCVKLNKIIV